MLPGSLKSFSRIPQDLPRPNKMTPKRLQDAPSSTQDASKISPRRPKRLQERSRCLQVAPRASQYSPKPLCSSIFGGFGPTHFNKNHRTWFRQFQSIWCQYLSSSLNLKFQSRYVNHTMSSGCPPRDDGGLRVAVSMRGGPLPAWLDRMVNGPRMEVLEARQGNAETVDQMVALLFGGSWVTFSQFFVAIFWLLKSSSVFLSIFFEFSSVFDGFLVDFGRIWGRIFEDFSCFS